MIKLADALQHSATVSDACRWAGISRETYYRYCKERPYFADRMVAAKENQYKPTHFNLTLF
jgi:ACT domain-containing protein